MNLRARRGLAIAAAAAGLACAIAPARAQSAAREATFTTPDGVTLWYRVVGEGPETVIAPLASFHGDRLDPLARGRRLVLYDLRGRGRSEAVPPSQVSLEHQFRDLDALADEVGAERFALIGWSGLGMELFVYALRHPGRVTRLVQLAPVPPRQAPYAERMMASRQARADTAALRELQALEASGEEDAATLCRAEARARRGATFADPARNAEAPDLCDLPNERAASLGPYFEALLGSIGAWDWRSRLAEIAIPRLVVHGAEDNIPLEGNREWVAGRQNARLLVVEDAGHWPHYEQPQVVLPALEAFLSGEWPAGSEEIP